MPPPDAAVARHRRLRRLGATATVEARRLWRQVDHSAVLASWRALVPRLLVVMTGAQQSAASGADDYLVRALVEQGIDAEPAGEVVARSLSGVASDGRPLDTLLERPAWLAVRTLARGEPPPRALAAGQASLQMIVRTQVADAGRVAEGVAIATTPDVGWVRMLVGPSSCSRCVVLAGRVYRWSSGFLRHPDDDCIHVPASGSTAGDLTTDPRAYFDGLPEDEQNGAFGKAGAQAIRDGADIGQVVNARRGMFTAADRRKLTRSGARSRGVGGARLMPEQIYRDATSREDAIRLLRRFGYIT